MLRTQVYLTNEEREGLLKLTAATGKSQSLLIREAVDHYIQTHSAVNREAVLRRTVGLWKDRTDLPDFDELRRGWDRS